MNANDGSLDPDVSVLNEISSIAPDQRHNGFDDAQHHRQPDSSALISVDADKTVSANVSINAPT
eukprot:276430-Pleurochrysis_carterae.AAC.1